jgi:hypothetical protein
MLLRWQVTHICILPHVEWANLGHGTLGTKFTNKMWSQSSIFSSVEYKALLTVNCDKQMNF